MFRFETLEIWGLAVAYGKRLYKVAEKFPKTETFALADQLKRAAVSISNNIAEGSGGSNKDFSNFLNISIKSILETVNILHFAQELNYINATIKDEFYKEAETLIRRIRAFRKTLL
jgi:four helix bundle protein